MGHTKIEWCDRVWNPITGCSPVSDGCRNCYARRMAQRLKGRYGYPQDDPFRVTFHPERLDEPLHWKKPSLIFVCSMGDLFHESVQDNWLHQVFAQMMTPQATKHIFLILTKRPTRMIKYINLKIPISWPLENYLLKGEGQWRGDLHPHIWFGVSVSNNKDLWMVETLLQIPAAKRFVSVEPMLEKIDIYPTPMHQGDKCLDWVICGGETGPNARPLDPDWVRNLRDQCQAAEVPFFFKSYGDAFLKTQQKNFIDHLLDGRRWNEIPPI